MRIFGESGRVNLYEFFLSSSLIKACIFARMKEVSITNPGKIIISAASLNQNNIVAKHVNYASRQVSHFQPMILIN